ncbi:MAG: hypothetical protein JW874_05965 [Spirochaetales bacterium]|nr:hypothetical protein [Spirochaetales bacterium]
MSRISIMCGGVLTLLMAIFHMGFPRIFGWKKDFSGLSEANRRIFYTIHIALYLLFIVLAAVSFIHLNELAEASGIARTLLAAVSLFWLLRTIWQVVYFRPQKKSKGMSMHIVLVAVFLLLALAWFIPLVSG